jgi:hypothetical protein
VPSDVWQRLAAWAEGTAWRWLPPSVVVALLALELERFTTVVARG